MKVLSLFSGIGAFEKALKNLGIETDLVGFCEIDKYAAKSYSAIHNVSEEKNLGDITKIDAKALPRDIDLITYGFPCQDISIAGKQKGLVNEDGTQTRSGLFFEALRIIEETKPKVAIAENVKNLVGKKFNAQFQVVLASLEAAGYNNYWSVLNAKNYGVPQNRERVFIVSIRKDIDRGLFQFPVPIALNKRLKDVLEEVVDEKYYLTMPMVKRLFTTGYTQMKYENRVAQEDGVVGTLCARDYKDPKCVQVAQMYPNSGNPQAGRVYDAEGLSPTMDTCGGGNRMPKIVEDFYKAREPRVYDEVSPTLRADRSGLKVMAYDEQNGYVRKDGCVGTIMTDGSSPKKNNRIIEASDPLVWDGFNQRIRADSSTVGMLTQNCGADLKRNGQGIVESALRIRKLTPKECFRLMGFDDEAFHKAEAVNSNSQLYKQAGNSIVVDVLEAIFRQMLDEQGNFTV